MARKYSPWIGKKIKKIMHEGIRGKKVPQKQAVAVALSMARKKKLKAPKKRKASLSQTIKRIARRRARTA